MVVSKAYCLECVISVFSYSVRLQVLSVVVDSLFMMLSFFVCSCCVVQYLVSFLFLQSSRLGKESKLLYINCDAFCDLGDYGGTTSSAEKRNLKAA